MVCLPHLEVAVRKNRFQQRFEIMCCICLTSADDRIAKRQFTSTISVCVFVCVVNVSRENAVSLWYEKYRPEAKRPTQFRFVYILHEPHPLCRFSFHFIPYRYGIFGLKATSNTSSNSNSNIHAMNGKTRELAVL